MFEIRGFLGRNTFPLLVPLARAYLRYVPTTLVKKRLWDWAWWRTFDFTATTVFGKKISGNTKDHIQKRIYYFGMWEPYLTAFLQGRLAAGDVFVDVGANIGYFSLLASGLVGQQGSVVAIEASPSIFELLNHNLAINGLKNVRGVNVAASNGRKSIRIYRASEENLGSTSQFTSRGVFEAEVPALPLSEILNDREKAKARVIKIDVEGAEVQVLKGMLPLSQFSHPKLEIVMEITPALLAQEGTDPAAVMEMMGEEGFYPYRFGKSYTGISEFLEKDRTSQPRRIQQSIDSMTDVIFSRIDADAL